MTSLRFCDFFAGVGGFRLGLERAGHRCVWSCEIEPYARAVYGARFGREPEGSDINAVEAKDIPDADLWCGGFPCQDVSTAGRRAGINGDRSGLFWRFVDLAAERRPRWLLLENVPGLLAGRDDDDDDPAEMSPPRGGGVEPASEPVSWFGAVLGALDELGYDVAWRVLDARFYGVPQRRRRVFILAGRAGDRPHPAAVLLEPARGSGNPPTRGASREVAAEGVARGAPVAGPIGCPGGRGGTRAEPWDGGGALIAAPGVAATLTPSRDAEGRSRLRPAGLGVGEDGDPSFTLKAQSVPAVAFSIAPESGNGADLVARETSLSPGLGTEGGNKTERGVHVVAAMAVRRLTPRECERLQGFPDDWTDLGRDADGHRYRCLGNAVAVPVIEWTGRRLAGVTEGGVS